MNLCVIVEIIRRRVGNTSPKGDRNDSGTHFPLGRPTQERRRLSVQACIQGVVPRGHLIYAHFASTQVSFERGRLREILFRWWAAGARKWAEV